MSENKFGTLFVFIMFTIIVYVFFKIIINERKEKNRKRFRKY